MEERVEAVILVVGVEAELVESIVSGRIIPMIARRLHEASRAKKRLRRGQIPVIGVEAWDLSSLRDVLELGRGDFTQAYYEANGHLFIAADSMADCYLNEIKEMLEVTYGNTPDYKRRPKIMRFRDIIVRACARRGATKIQAVTMDPQLTDLIESAAETASLEVRRSNAQLQRQLTTMFYEANLDLDNGGRRNAFENFNRAAESSLRRSGADLLIVSGESHAFAESLTENIPVVGLLGEQAEIAVDWAFDKIFSGSTPPPSC